MSTELVWQRGELLGTGAFGQVYSGIDMKTGTRIAVKEVSLGGGKRHRAQARALQQEIRILSELDHPNIIRYLGTEFSEGTIRIFLELASEGSIRDALREFGEI
jgi:serine/threonine protein kinase